MIYKSLFVDLKNNDFENGNILIFPEIKQTKFTVIFGYLTTAKPLIIYYKYCTVIITLKLLYFKQNSGFLQESSF